MSRKHFQAMAEVIRVIASKAQRKQAAQYAAQVCAASNPRFDKARFLAACGVE